MPHWLQLVLVFILQLIIGIGFGQFTYEAWKFLRSCFGKRRKFQVGEYVDEKKDPKLPLFEEKSIRGAWRIEAIGKTKYRLRYCAVAQGKLYFETPNISDYPFWYVDRTHERIFVAEPLRAVREEVKG